jgi:chromosome segregation ATPase
MCLTALRTQGHHSEGREKERSKWDEAPSRGHSNEVEALKRQLRDKEGVIADLTDSLEAEKRASQKAKAEVVALQESLKESKVQVRGCVTGHFSLGRTTAVHGYPPGTTRGLH